MNLSPKQRAQLRTQGITVLIERNDGVCTCMTREGRKRMSIDDLKEMAKPGFCDRLTAWIGRRASV